MVKLRLTRKRVGKTRSPVSLAGERLESASGCDGPVILGWLKVRPLKVNVHGAFGVAAWK
jgi:hypothetical protein